MKKLIQLFVLLFVANASISCSNSDPDTPIVTPVTPVVEGNTGDLRLFVIDTA